MIYLVTIGGVEEKNATGIVQNVTARDGIAMRKILKRYATTIIRHVVICDDVV